jgi:molecular chaperone DnaJ
MRGSVVTATTSRCVCPSPSTEAALGGEIEVPTLDGSPVTLRIKPGTQPGSRHRVRGKGVVTAKHHGDLIVTVDVQVPTHLTAEQRSAVEAYAAATRAAAGASAQGERV